MALVLGWFGGAEPAGAQEPTGTTIEDGGEMVTALPSDWATGRPVDAEGGRAAQELLAAFKDAFGVRAGIFMATDDGYRLPIVGLTDEDVTLANGLADGVEGTITAVDAPMSEARAEELMLALAGQWPEEDVVVGTDLEAGVVTVAIVDEERTSEPEVRSVIESVGQELIARGEQDGSVDATVESAALVRVERGAVELVDARSSPPVRGGRWVVGNGPKNLCTAGFLFKNSGGALRHSFAGHCATSTGVTVDTLGGTYVGAVIQDEPDGWDVATFTLPSSYDGLAAVTISSAGNYRPVDTWATAVSGAQLCFAGHGIWDHDTDDERCGTQNRSVVSGGKTLYCIERRTFGGDSGGPVYGLSGSGWVIAAGTMVLSYQDTAAIPDRWFACYNRMSSVLSATDYTLVTWGSGSK